MAYEIKSPNDYSDDMKMFKVFFGGAIDMGKAKNWQEELSKLLGEYDDILILNPRRDDWDSSWKQTLDDDKFSEQVNWEFNAMSSSDLIIIYFTDDSKAPISLLELGMFSGSKKICVFCTDKFYRFGNVQFVCDKFKIPMFSDNKKLVDHVVDHSKASKKRSTIFSSLNKG